VKLRIDDITAEAKELALDEPVAEINRLLERGPIREYHLTEAVAVELSYYRSGMDVVFAGALKAPAEATCARCAEQFATSCARSFRFVLAPKAVGEPDGDLRAEDLEFSFYEGEEIDVSPLIREQVLLALPTRPLCKEDCRGLCPQCGANLNREACGCAVAAQDLRFGILRTLKVQRS
jgi:uncharacterized protein